MTSSNSPLDYQLEIAFFQNAGASSINRCMLSLRQAVEGIQSTSAKTKSELPWIKLARFGEKRTAKGSLRHDENVLDITGIEADYDGERISIDEAAERLHVAGVAAVVYASPSHRPDAPRWRILCPLSGPMPITDRAPLVARLNGLFGGALSRESFTLSQAYYYGAVEGAPDHRVLLVDGRFLDHANELDAGAVAKAPPHRAASPMPASAGPAQPFQGVATAYGEAALASACDAIRYAPDGAKHETLNREAYSMGGLVASGELPDGETFRALLAAVHELRPRCKDFRAAERTLRQAYYAGKGVPRAVEPMPEPPPPESHPFLARMSEASAALQRAASAKPLPVPPDIMAVEGALKLFVDHCEDTAISAQPFLALAAGITAIGALAGRRYRTTTNLRSNIYCIGVADSGGGKDHARKCIKNALVHAGLTQYLGGEDIASGTAMMTALHRHPSILFQIDEFGDWLNDVLSPKSAPHKKSIAQRLKTLYSDAGAFVSGTEYADQSRMGKPREDIYDPHACLYGTTTPSQFWRAIAGGSMEDGLLARFLIFVTPESYPDHRRPAFTDPPGELIAAFQAVAAGAADAPAGDLAKLMLASAKSEPYTVPMTEGAERAYDAMDLEQLARLRKAAGTYVTSIAGRLTQNSMKLALVRAVSANPARPVITEEFVAWGRALSEHCIDTLLREASDNVAETQYEKNVQAAIRIIKRHGPMTASKMFRNGWTIPERERNEILRSLTDAGRFIATTKPGGTGKGRPSVTYSIAPD